MGGNGTVTAKFDVSITNVGGSGGHDAVSLSMAIDGQEPVAMAIVPRPPEGSEVEFNVTAEVEPKIQPVVVRVGDAEQEITLDARTPDIVLRALGHTILARGIA